MTITLDYRTKTLAMFGDRVDEVEYHLGLKTPRKQTTKLCLQNFEKLLIETVLC